MRWHKFSKTISALCKTHSVQRCVFIVSFFLVACAQQPTELSATSYQTTLWLANQYIKRGDYVGASRLLETVAHTRRTSDWYASSGLLYAEQGFVDKAVAAYRSALQQSPKNINAQLNYASLLIQQQDYHVAQEYLQNVIAHGSYHMRALAYFNLGVLYARTNRVQLATDNFWQAATSCAHCSNRQKQVFLRQYLTFSQTHTLEPLVAAKKRALFVACRLDDFRWLADYKWFQETHFATDVSC